MTAVTLRRADPADHDAIVALDGLGGSTRRLLREDLSSPSRRILVAVAGSEVAGVAMTTRGDQESHLLDIAVAPQHRRRGLATRLLASVAVAALAEDETAMTLESRVSNVASHRLYEGLGFSNEGIRPGYYQDGEDAVVMWHRRLRDLALMADALDADVGRTAAVAAAPVPHGGGR